MLLKLLQVRIKVKILCVFTISAHAQSQTLLQTAVLAAVAVSSVDEAIPLAGARVHGIVLLAAAKETLEIHTHTYYTYMYCE